MDWMLEWMEWMAWMIPLNRKFIKLWHTVRIESTSQQSTTTFNQNTQDDFFFGDEIIWFRHWFENSDAEIEDIYTSHVLITCSQLTHIQLSRNYSLNIINYLLLLQLNVYFHMHNLPHYNRLTDQNFERYNDHINRDKITRIKKIYSKILKACFFKFYL